MAPFKTTKGNVRLLSHALSPTTPTYPRTDSPIFEETSRIAHGATANWMTVTFQNHAGTHVDGPWHFNPKGRRITEIDPGEFIFTRPLLADIPKDDGEVVTGDDLATALAARPDADLLLIRTGFGQRFRDADPERYRHQSPGFAASAGEFVLASAPSIRAIGMDFVSATSQRFVADGHAFHRLMAGSNRDDRYVFLIEDVRLDSDLTAADLGRVTMAPLLLADQDGGPVTLFAEPATA